MLVGDTPLPPLDTPEFVTVAEEVDWLRAQLDAKRLHNRELETMNDYYKQQLYGKKSERIKPKDENQQTLFGIDVATKDDPEAAADTPPERPAKKKKQRNGGGRKPVSDQLETIEEIIPATDEQKVGPDGEAYVLLGYDIAERLHVEAARALRLLVKREKWGPADTHCVLAVAAVPPSIIPKGKLTDGAVCELMHGKYILGLPFYRQVADYNLTDAELNTSLCSDAAKRFAAFMQPIRQAILAEILDESFIHIDETVMRELAKGACLKRYLWAWHAGKNTYFHYGGRGTRAVRSVLAHHPDGDDFDDNATHAEANSPFDPGYHGFFMADGLNVYQHLPAKTDQRIQLLLCMVHARRQFVKLAEAFGHAEEIVKLFNAVMKVDREIRKHCTKKQLHGQDATDYTYAERQTHALPALKALHDRMASLRPHFVGMKDMAAAFAYSLDRWHDLTRYTTRGDLPIDNNAAERAIRPVVIGRKNYLFVGSEDAGDWCATNYTIFESARAHRIDPRWYIARVTTAIHAGRTDYEALTPSALLHTYQAQRAK